MKITVTLTAQQVQELAQQINGGAVTAHAVVKSHARVLSTATKRIRKIIDMMSKDKMFSSSMIQIKTGYASWQISGVLKDYAKKGQVEMVKRGTWKKIA